MNGTGLPTGTPGHQPDDPGSRMWLGAEAVWGAGSSTDTGLGDQETLLRLQLGGGVGGTKRSNR